jgi:hypothetical protein
MSDEQALIVAVSLAVASMAGCQAYRYRQEGMTERTAIEAGYCRDATWKPWYPCRHLEKQEPPR